MLSDKVLAFWSVPRHDISYLMNDAGELPTSFRARLPLADVLLEFRKLVNGVAVAKAEVVIISSATTHTRTQTRQTDGLTDGQTERQAYRQTKTER